MNKKDYETVTVSSLSGLEIEPVKGVFGMAVGALAYAATGGLFGSLGGSSVASTIIEAGVFSVGVAAGYAAEGLIDKALDAIDYLIHEAREFIRIIVEGLGSAIVEAIEKTKAKISRQDGEALLEYVKRLYGYGKETVEVIGAVITAIKSKNIVSFVTSMLKKMAMGF